MVKDIKISYIRKWPAWNERLQNTKTNKTVSYFIWPETLSLNTNIEFSLAYDSIKLYNILGCSVVLIFSWLNHITIELPCINTKLTNKTYYFLSLFGLTSVVFSLFLTTPVNNRQGAEENLDYFPIPYIKGTGSHWKLLQTK